MKRALAIAAVLFSTTLTAQQRAPGNDSITQADLRADLFFLAGDAMRGRLTDTNENRLTASLSYTTQFGDGNLWATTLAWGRKYNSPGNTLDGFLTESELIFKNGVTLFGRAEHVQNDELHERDEIVTGFSQHQVYAVSKVSAGGIYDFIRTPNAKFGLGALASRYVIPDALKADYGDPTSYMIFARLKIQ